MHHELLRLPDVLARTGWARSSIYKMVRAGAFPSPVRAVAWIGSEVDSWIAKRILETRGAPPKSARLDGLPAAMSPERTT